MAEERQAWMDPAAYLAAHSSTIMNSLAALQHPFPAFARCFLGSLSHVQICFDSRPAFELASTKTFQMVCGHWRAVIAYIAPFTAQVEHPRILVNSVASVTQQAADQYYDKFYTKHLRDPHVSSQGRAV